jgi:catechol 2,3-dioxygenase-like lactoylglutathione lyase family enzyme
MRPSFKVLTLAVSDLDRSLRFYREGLGLPTEGVIGEEYEGGAVVFIHLKGGMILALWPTESLEKDAKVQATGNRLGAITIGHITISKEEVVSIIEAARKAGATVTAEPKDTFWGGFSGYFHDPDGHIWEIAWHPEWSPQEAQGT